MQMDATTAMSFAFGPKDTGKRLRPPSRKLAQVSSDLNIKYLKYQIMDIIDSENAVLFLANFRFSHWHILLKFAGNPTLKIVSRARS
jgi:hypothetical protein